jgi:hypothetical protein
MFRTDVSGTRSRSLVVVLAAVLLTSGVAVVTSEQPSTGMVPGWCCWVR